MNKYDLIGDIHGHLGSLQKLLIKLGYNLNTFSHPEGRQVVFLGDYIDRGPDSLGVLKLVKNFVDNGNAQAIMGNHELNAISWYVIKDDGSEYCRPHSSKNRAQFQKTLDAFNQLPQSELDEWLNWMKALPLAIETEEFRAVHACWHPFFTQYYLDKYWGKTLDEDFIRRASDPYDGAATPLLTESVARENTDFWMIEVLLKGLQSTLPEDETFTDKGGTVRKEARLTWWKDLTKTSLNESLLGVEKEIPHELTTKFQDTLDPIFRISDQIFTVDQSPIFIGHYWRSPIELPNNCQDVESFELKALNHEAMTVNPLKKAIYCLDYSIAIHPARGLGKLVAYQLDHQKAVAVG